MRVYTEGLALVTVDRRTAFRAGFFRAVERFLEVSRGGRVQTEQDLLLANLFQSTLGSLANLMASRHLTTCSEPLSIAVTYGRGYFDAVDALGRHQFELLMNNDPYADDLAWVVDYVNRYGAESASEGPV